MVGAYLRSCGLVQAWGLRASLGLEFRFSGLAHLQVMRVAYAEHIVTVAVIESPASSASPSSPAASSCGPVQQKYLRDDRMQSSFDRA